MLVLVLVLVVQSVAQAVYPSTPPPISHFQPQDGMYTRLGYVLYCAYEQRWAGRDGMDGCISDFPTGS